VIGQIIHMKDDRLTIKTADDTRMVVERDKVAKKLTPESGGEGEGG
jgi:preprotein translocase subunit YajC